MSYIYLLQTSSTSRSYHQCLSRWGRRSACVCSTAGRSFAFTCRRMSCGRMTQWGCAAPSMATFKTTSCKCVLADLWSLLRSWLTPPPIIQRECILLFQRQRGRWWWSALPLTLTLSVMHTGRRLSIKSPALWSALLGGLDERPTGHATSTRNLLLAE